MPAAAPCRFTMVVPVVSVIVLAGEASPRGALAALAAQSVQSWQAIVIGSRSVVDSGACADPRVEFLEHTGTVLHALSPAIAAANGQWLLFQHARDRLIPTALQTLLEASTEHAGAAGEVAFTSPLGPLPRSIHGPASTAPPSPPSTLLGPAQVLGTNAIDPAAQIIRRDLALAANFDVDAGDAAFFSLFAHLAINKGVRWARVPQPIVERPLAGPHSDMHVLTTIQHFARVLRATLAHARDHPEQPPNPTLHAAAEPFSRALVSAGAGLLSHIESPPVGHPGPGLNAAACARWWGRLSFTGPVPGHLLPDPFGEVPSEAALRRSVVARIVATCEHDNAVLLLGLGRNARALARAFASRGTNVFGFDESLHGAPAWSLIDGCAIAMVRAGEPFPAHARPIMTLSVDDTFLHRLRNRPDIDRIVRWSVCERETTSSVQEGRPSDARPHANATAGSRSGPIA